jgi:pre-mRNA-splicing factor SYF2
VSAAKPSDNNAASNQTQSDGAPAEPAALEESQLKTSSEKSESKEDDAATKARQRQERFKALQARAVSNSVATVS